MTSSENDKKVNHKDNQYIYKAKDIILFSTVRSGDTIGFLNDYRRMNVALSRSKQLLIIYGKEDTLKKDPKWKKIIEQINNQNGKIDLFNKEQIEDEE